MKQLIATLILTAVSTAATAHAESSTGLWERFCTQNKIGDACERAVKSIHEEVRKFEADQPIEQAMDLQRRLETVAEMGCSLNNPLCCEQKEKINAEEVYGEVAELIESDETI